MRVDVIRASQLTPEHAATWSAIQASDRSLHSPLFSPEFTQLVASVRDDVEIAVLEDNGSIVGFFPYHRTSGDIGRPIGLRLSDLHGAIVRSDLAWSADQVVRHSRLLAWHFDHLIAAQTGFRPFHWTECCSPFIDLAEGFESYCAQRRRAGSQLIAQVLRKSRKVERDLGPLRFTPHSDCPRDLENLINWKSQQHRRTGVLEIFRIPWVAALAKLTSTARSDRFAGMLSTLTAGDKLLAVHLGLRSSDRWHIWFPTFDTQFAQYSPGLILLLEMARAAPQLGIDRIDLGKGPERYKASFMSGAEELAEGSVDCRPVVCKLRRSWHGTKHWIRGSNLRAPLNTPLRWTRRFRQWLSFR